MHPKSELPPSHFRIRPALNQDLEWISDLQKDLYPDSDAVPLSRLQEWFRKNPSGFFVLEDHRGHASGQITFLPLKPDCMHKYQMEGPAGLTEREVRADDLFAEGEREEITDLYLESVILPSTDRREASQALRRALPGLIRQLTPKPEAGHIFALAATAAGERWLTRMGFSIISRAETRRDGHPMYQTSLSAFMAVANGSASA